MSLQGAAILDRMLDPVARCFTPEVARRLVDLQPDPATQARITQLAAKANEGELSPEERAEYEDYVEAVDLIGILKAKAGALLAGQTDR